MHIIIFLAGLFSFSLSAETLKLFNYDYYVHDIADRGLTKEDLYQRMNRLLVRHKDSICSNRAHVWAWDFKVHDIDSPKIFLFFTPKTGTFDGLSWWYHVVPLINEGGQLWTMDAGYPKRVNAPLSVEDWIQTFNGKDAKCKEIKNTDKDLIELMARGGSFPEKTSHGTYDCYYQIAPPGYWTPAQVARNLLQENFNRDEMNENEVMDACIEASTNPLGWVVGATLGHCRYFLAHGSLKI